MADGVVAVVLENNRMKIQTLEMVVLVVLVLTELYPEEIEELLTIVIPEMVAQRGMVVLVLLEALLVR